MEISIAIETSLRMEISITAEISHAMENSIATEISIGMEISDTLEISIAMFLCHMSAHHHKLSIESGFYAICPQIIKKHISDENCAMPHVRM